MGLAHPTRKLIGFDSEQIEVVSEPSMRASLRSKELGARAVATKPEFRRSIGKNRSEFLHDLLFRMGLCD
jgi:hypothetical protein